jgi:cytochrome bd-type quinol oxidase subunit 2
MLPMLVAGIAGVALTAYVLLGGADYGGGVWDLLASGPRREKQRELIAHAIGPIWEANHVWLILVVVLLFTCFPPAFAQLMTVLHIPITLLLIGIVLRGSAFTFRAYDATHSAVQERWGMIFAIASVRDRVERRGQRGRHPRRERGRVCPGFCHVVAQRVHAVGRRDDPRVGRVFGRDLSHR